MPDIECAQDLIDDIPYAGLVADKGCDANALAQSIEHSGNRAVIRPHSNRIAPRQYGRLIERFINRIKYFRRIASRYDKFARS